MQAENSNITVRNSRHNQINRIPPFSQHEKEIEDSQKTSVQKRIFRESSLNKGKDNFSDPLSGHLKCSAEREICKMRQQRWSCFPSGSGGSMAR